MGSTLSVVASVALIRSTFNDFVPEELHGYLRNFTSRFSSDLTMVVQDSHEGSNNHFFSAVVTYLGSKALAATSSSSPQRLTIGKNENVKSLTFGLDRNSEIVDIFDGVPMKWRYNSDFNPTLHVDIEWYEVRFHKKHMDMVKNKYLPHIIDVAKGIKDQNRVVKFYTSSTDRWSPNAIKFDHPMTFNTLAIDGDLKRRVIDDLDNFINGKEYYKNIGKVQKRGYLLYGPPGTGKSSLIAAMANYLNFDVFNLNLSGVTSDCTLEYLLLHVSNRSILVMEDIDCSIKLQNRELGDNPDRFPNHQITLSGLLNVIDGLLSCCGDERIIVFTTNFKDRIDPALLRPGRMDMHVCLSYCKFSIFKQLASNYLEISNHNLFSQVEKLIGEVQVTPAEVAGELMMNTRDPKTCLEGLIRFLKSKVEPNLPTDWLHQGSEAQPSTAPLLASNLVEHKPEKESDDCPGQNSSVMTDLANVDSLNDSEVKFAAADSTPILKVGDYTIKAELVPILRVVVLKHGDIAANSSLHSMQCRSFFLETVCDIILKLQVMDFENLTQEELKSILTNVRDLESVKLNVGWLNQRLNEIIEAKQLVEYRSTLKEDMSKDVQYIEEKEKELEACKVDTLALQEKSLHIEAASEKLTESKLSCFYHRSLVDGLL